MSLIVRIHVEAEDEARFVRGPALRRAPDPVSMDITVMPPGPKDDHAAAIVAGLVEAVTVASARLGRSPA